MNNLLNNLIEDMVFYLELEDLPKSEQYKNEANVNDLTKDAENKC